MAVPHNLPVTVQGDSLLLAVRAQPGARRAGVVGLHGGRLKVAVTAAPEKGKANDALIEVLVDSLKLKRSQISLASGQTSAQKAFRITGLTAEELASRLTAVLPDSAT